MRAQGLRSAGSGTPGQVAPRAPCRQVWVKPALRLARGRQGRPLHPSLRLPVALPSEGRAVSAASPHWACRGRHRSLWSLGCFKEPAYSSMLPGETRVTLGCQAGSDTRRVPFRSQVRVCEAVACLAWRGQDSRTGGSLPVALSQIVHRSPLVGALRPFWVRGAWVTRACVWRVWDRPHSSRASCSALPMGRARLPPGPPSCKAKASGPSGRPCV